jgi:hypothetical protein
MGLLTPASTIANFHRTTRAALAAYPLARAHSAVFFAVAVALVSRATRQSFYSILWAVVFGFATLNILSLAARRFEPTRRGLTFGELMAVCTVFISIFLLGWEMLNLFHIFPIKLRH